MQRQELESRVRQASFDADGRGLANALGWFSVGLGAAELVAPGAVARFIGLDDAGTKTNTVLRAYGIRELAAGVGILSSEKPAEWLWSRVAGDMLDLATLGAALNRDDANRGKLLLAAAAVLGVTALDFAAAREFSAQGSLQGKTDGVRRVVRAVHINKSPEEVYGFWRRLENLPRFMEYLETVQETGGNRSHWVVKGPFQVPVEWDAEMVTDEPNREIAWRSVDGAMVHNAGRVLFEPGGGTVGGTNLKVELAYAPPAGVVGVTVAKMLGAEPEQQVYDDLRRFKNIMETGEVVLSDASLWRMRPAVPQGETERQIAGALS